MKNILNKILSTIFPVQCALCKKDNEYVCAKCESGLELNSKKNNGWINAKYKYQNYNLKKIEYKIKYNHHPKLAGIMGEYSYEFIIKKIVNKINPNSNSINIFLIPIPISKDRLKQRGYNQTEYIAEGILKEAENKMNTNFKILNILKRKETIKLKDIYGVDNRSEEMRYSMSVDISLIGGSEAAATTEDKDVSCIINNTNVDLKNKSNFYILIDDITTTGSTFYEARRALTEYGIISENIYGYALAH
jgi:predicted amidophosphoribosyltransferase